jgi:hypothetical protein
MMSCFNSDVIFLLSSLFFPLIQSKASNVVLASDVRAAEREKFELKRKENEAKKQADDLEKKTNQEKKRLEEHIKLRKAMEFKARPYNVQQSDAFVCIPSNSCLTVPVSPKLHTSVRMDR